MRASNGPAQKRLRPSGRSAARYGGRSAAGGRGSDRRLTLWPLSDEASRMIPSDLPLYPSYKLSGVEWLGDVPAHWEVRRVRSIAQIINGATPASNRPEYWEGNISWLTPEDLGQLPSRYVNKSARRITNEGYHACGTVLAPAGSLALSTRAPIGHLGILSSTACVNQGCRLLVPNEAVQSEYLYYELEVVRPELESLGQGSTFTELSRAKLAGFALAVPPLPEQTAIARFLDHADRRIQRYIRAKQKLIALLEEQKQAIIHQAVTGQIDVRTGQPYPAYKPSGVEWLGEVPAHWEMVRNGRLFVQRNEIGFPELPILEVSLKTGIRIRDFENPDRKQVMSDRSMYKRAVKGDIAYNMMRMWQGAVGVTPVDGLISPAYVVAKPLTGTEPRYFGALFRTSAYMAEVDKYSRGIVKDRNRLYWEDFKQMPTPCPPPDEQGLIADAIEHSTAITEDGIRRIECQIGLLHEYRTRLIADVVTGKLDVREAAATLPEVDPLTAADTLNTDISERDLEG